MHEMAVFSSFSSFLGTYDRWHGLPIVIQKLENLNFLCFPIFPDLWATVQHVQNAWIFNFFLVFWTTMQDGMGLPIVDQKIVRFLTYFRRYQNIEPPFLTSSTLCFVQGLLGAPSFFERSQLGRKHMKSKKEPNERQIQFLCASIGWR